MQAPSFKRLFQNVWPAALIALLTLAVYHNTFSSPLLLDDHTSISENHSIRDLSKLGEVLSPPKGITPSGRPVLNLSLAVNYAISRKEVWSYHVANLLIHLGAGLALFGLAHRTLLLPSLRARFGADARPLALIAALLWTLHPLQTESVTYIVQRAESLMGLFYLLTLYCYVRSTDSPAPGRWQVLSVASCALGMATKEVMVTAPIMVLLHDRAFAAGSFREAWRQRRRLYMGLEATWAILGFLVASTGGNRDGTVGPGVETAWIVYFLAQIKAVAHYLWLSVWPHPLIFEFGWFEIKGFAQLAPSLLVVGPLAGLTLFALWRHPRLGFLGGWFFGILALTSIMPGTTQIIVEHRMYLSLAAVVTGLLLLTHAWWDRRCWPAWIALILVLGAVTVRRNHDYRSPLALWQQTLEHRPDYGLANYCVGQALLAEDRTLESVPYFERAIKSAPHRTLAYIGLALALDHAGRTDDAAKTFEEALKFKPTSADTHRYYGALLSRIGRHRDSLVQLDEAIRLKPEEAKNYNETGIALGRAGHLIPAVANFERALELDPESVVVVNNLGYALMRLARFDEARARFQQALRLDPDYISARTNLAHLAKLTKQ
ncbi:MAG: tetratricopeptide repeat protein [Opitutae bacterium]|nr:tetratricopeptide repeat protein [Opitutae bacterium]